MTINENEMIEIITIKDEENQYNNSNNIRELALTLIILSYMPTALGIVLWIEYITQSTIIVNITTSVIMIVKWILLFVLPRLLQCKNE